MSASVKVYREVRRKVYDSDDELCFQWCEYRQRDESGNRWSEWGYRFMWRNTLGNLVAHRGQARIPSWEVLQELIQEADREGWGGLSEPGT